VTFILILIGFLLFPVAAAVLWRVASKPVEHLIDFPGIGPIRDPALSHTFGHALHERSDAFGAVEAGHGAASSGEAR
jgi:hypothetical protein